MNIVCKTCGAEKPITDYNFSGDADLGYRRKICKECQRIRRSQLRKINKPVKMSVIDEFLCKQTYVSMLATCWEWK